MSVPPEQWEEGMRLRSARLSHAQLDRLLSAPPSGEAPRPASRAASRSAEVSRAASRASLASIGEGREEGPAEGKGDSTPPLAKSSLQPTQSELDSDRELTGKTGSYAYMVGGWEGGGGGGGGAYELVVGGGVGGGDAWA